MLVINIRQIQLWTLRYVLCIKYMPHDPENGVYLRYGQSQSRLRLKNMRILVQGVRFELTYS